MKKLIALTVCLLTIPLYTVYANFPGAVYHEPVRALTIDWGHHAISVKFLKWTCNGVEKGYKDEGLKLYRNHPMYEEMKSFLTISLLNQAPVEVFVNSNDCTRIESIRLFAS